LYSPAKIDFFLMSKKCFIESSCFEKDFTADDHTAPVAPENLYRRVIMSLIFFDDIKNSSPAKGITQTINKPPAAPAYSNWFLLCQERIFGNAGSYIPVLVHHIQQRIQPTGVFLHRN
jgi:hypothetical protein